RGRVREPQRELIHPDVTELEDPIDPAVDPEGARAQAEQPLVVYPTAHKIRNNFIADAVKTVLGPMQPGDIPDPIPESVRERYGLLPLLEALRQIHLPQTLESAELARETMRFHEAFVLQAALARRRLWADSFEAVPRAHVDGGLLDQLDASLPFTLTEGQQAVAAEIREDLASDRPMQRLLQGEVGSGKTVVALRAMLAVIDAGGQAALLAPTEVLVAQHAHSLQQLMGELAAGGGLIGPEHATRITVLTGSTPAKDRRAAPELVASWEAGIVVSTHALLSDEVRFADLGLLVVDEQHRFGVEQRAALSGRAEQRPHVLVMTATPIPRTVAMTVFGDLLVSTLTEIPAGRSEVSTVVVDERANPGWVDRAWQRIVEEVEQGRQAVVVCSRIGGTARAKGAKGTGDDEGRGVEELYAELSEGPLSGVRVAMLHGQLPTDEKDAVMSRFVRGELDVLVATTVVEVGVDVPNASVMVRSDAERFGISQLHQLRGRIGRGEQPGARLLLPTAERGTPARERLDAVAGSRDGFRLAEVDLAQRREGD